MTKIIIEYNSEDFRGIMLEQLDKIIDVTPNCKVIIDFTNGDNK